MENVGKKSSKSIEEYRHSIKLLKYHLKKEQKINETLKYKDSKKNKKERIIKQTKVQQKHVLYALLEIVNTLTFKLKDMGLTLGDIFRMADHTYDGEITKEQFMVTVSKLKANLDETQINQMFYAIDSNLNGMLSTDEYSQFLWAHGGSESKQAFNFQKETSQKFMAILKKKNIKSEDFIKKLLNPIPLDSMNAELKKLSLNINQIMILFKMWDPSLSGLIKHEVYLKSMQNVKQKDEKQIQNEKYEKGIKELCVIFRDRKINPIEIYELSDTDGKEGISIYELETGFKKLFPEETTYQIKKWINLININGDNEITKEEYVSAIRSFYSLQQIDNFSVQYDKIHPKLKKALAEEELPAQKIINQLSIYIEDNGLTKTEVFHRIDINHNGLIDKTELLDGLKNLGIKIGFIGKVLAVFDRDVSGEIGLDEWLSILGEDLQMEIVDEQHESPPKEKSKPKKEQKPEKPKNKVKQVKKNIQQSPKKEVSKSKQPPKPPSKPKQTIKKSVEVGSNIKSSKKGNEVQKKPISQSKKQEQKKPLKDQDKNKSNSSKEIEKIKPSSKKKDSKIITKKPQPFQEFADEQLADLKQTYSQEEISTQEVEKEVAQTYASSSKKVTDIFLKCSKNKKKGLSQKQLSQFMKELKLRSEYDDKKIKKIFEDNCSNNGLITTEWFQKLMETFDLTPVKESVPQQKKKPQPPKKESISDLPKIPKSIIESKLPQKQKEQQIINDGEDDYNEQFQNNDTVQIENTNAKQNEGQRRGKDLQEFQQLQTHNLEPQTISDEGYKLKKLISCQDELQLLETKYKPQANSIKKNKKIYQDKAFPANLSSLTNLPPNQSQIPNVTLLKWKHYKEIYSSPQLFKNSISPNDIRQGKLGDCYFLCSLAALAEYKNLIERLFEYFDVDNGYFLVWVCIDGSWKLIELDGYIPVSPNADKPAFSHGDQEQLWVMLLEKAYAKAYGSYEKINGGQPYEAIKDLTGAPGQSFCHTKQEIKIDDVWKKLVDSNKQQFMMTCGTDVDKQGKIKMEGHSQSVTNEGIVLGHAYSILDVRQYKKQRLIQLRNPWGETQWKGEWSDKSSKWTEQAKKELNYTSLQEDGIFWMPFQAFFEKYNTTAINYIRPSYFYSSQTRKNVKSLVLKISQNSFKHGFIMVTQKDHRKDALPPNTPYNMNHMIALQYKKGKIVRQISNEKYLYQRQGSVQISSNDSQTVILINLEKKTDVNLCSYADSPFIYEVDEENEAMMNYIEDIATMEQRVKDVQEIANYFKTWMSSVGQYAFLVFKGIAKKQISFQVQFAGPKNIELIPKASKVDLKLKVGETKCIKGKIQNLKEFINFGGLEFSFDQ